MVREEKIQYIQKILSVFDNAIQPHNLAISENDNGVGNYIHVTNITPHGIELATEEQYTWDLLNESEIDKVLDKIDIFVK